MRPDVDIGPARPEHDGFVRDAWREGTREYAEREGLPWSKADHNRLMEDVVENGVVIVATKDGAFAGWVAARPSDGHIYYIYVKRCFRGFGIARALYETLNANREEWTTYARGFHVSDELRERYRVKLLS